MVDFPSGCLDNPRNKRLGKITLGKLSGRFWSCVIIFYISLIIASSSWPLYTVGVFCLGGLVLISVLIYHSTRCQGYYHKGNGRCYQHNSEGCPPLQKLNFKEKNPTCICEDGFTDSTELEGYSGEPRCLQWFTSGGGYCQGGKILTNHSQPSCQDNECPTGKSLHMWVSMRE